MFQITKPGRTRSTGDSRAAALITTRLQREASLGSLAKRNIKTWRLCRNGNMNDTPSSLRSTSKVRSHSVSRKVVQCSADSLRQQTMNLTKVPMTAMTVALATHEKKGGNCFIHPWHLHLPFGKAWSEPDPRMRRYPQTRSHAITESLWQWWRNLQATLYAVPLTHVIRSGTVSLRGWMISLANCPDTVGEHPKWRLWRWWWK